MASEFARQLQLLQSSSWVSTQQQTLAWKKLLCQTINETLVDLSRISDESSQSQYEVTLDFILHNVTEFPHMFSANSGIPDISDPNETQEEKESYAITCWVLSHVLRILAHPECIKLQEKALNVTVVILRTVLSKSPFGFRKLASEFIACLAELAFRKDEFYGEDVEENVQVVVDRFCIDVDVLPSDAGDKRLAPHPVLLTQPEELEQLQINISKILCSVALPLCQFASSCVYYLKNHNPQLLWATIGCQLEFGEVALKTASLDLSVKLLELGGLPGRHPLDYYVECLVALVKLLASGFSDIPGDYILLENALGDALNTLMHVTLMPGCNEEVRLTLNQMLHDGLLLAATVHGTRNLRTQHLKTTICDTISSLYTRLPRDMLVGQLASAKRNQFNKSMIQELGQLPDSQWPTFLKSRRFFSEAVLILQYLVKCLCACACLELPAECNFPSLVHIGKVRDNATLGGNSTRKRRLGSAPKTSSNKEPDELSDCGGEEDYKHNTPPTIRMVMHKLEQLLDQITAGLLQEQTYRDLLEGVRCCVEVMCWCIPMSVRKKEANDSALEMCKKNRKLPAGLTTSIATLGHSLNSLLLQKLCTSWKDFLFRSSKETSLKTEVAPCYISIVKSIGALAFVQDLVQFNSECLHNFTWMLSIAWLPNDVSWMDLKPKDGNDIAILSGKLADYLDASCRAECIQILAMLPKATAPKWKSHVLQLAIGDPDDCVRAAAVTCFAFFLHHCGPNTNHMVYDVLHGVLEDKSNEVLEAMASIVGPLACVVSRKSILQRTAPKDAKQLTYQSWYIKCFSCDDDLVVEDHGSPKDRPKIVDSKMFLPFMNLLKHDNSQLKSALIENLKRLFGHIRVRANNVCTVNMTNLCLDLMEDTDYHVRFKFSKAIRYLVGEIETEAESETDQMIVEKIIKKAKSVRSTGAVLLMETILLTAGELGRAAKGDLLFNMLMVLLNSIIFPSCSVVSAVARQQIKEIAEHKKLKVRQLLNQYSQNLFKYLVDQLHDSRRRGPGRDPLDILQDVAEVFQIHDLDSFLRRKERLLLPHLVKKATPTASQLIRTLARQLDGSNRKGPLVRNIREIFCHLVLTCGPEELQKSFTFLEQETGCNIEALVPAGWHTVSELLLHLSTHHDQVISGLRIFKRLRKETAEEDLVEWLQPQLLGTLVYFDNHLNNNANPVVEKKKAYESLICLMRLIGQKHITAVRVRLMTTLKIGLKFKDPGFPELCCRAWNCFVHSVEVSALGPMLSQVAVNLLPLLHQLPKQVSQILVYLVVENRKALNEHFHELYFLPDLPELADINAVLRKYTDGSEGSGDVKTHFQNLLKGVNHESLDVRQLALSKLKNLLHKNQELVHRLSFGSETVDPLISQMVSVLLSGCRESDLNIRSLYGECLGELGAIDPGRLELMTNGPKQNRSRFQATVEDDNFAYELINELAKAFLRAEDRNTQDCVSYAIQELIKIYNISVSDGVSSSSGRSGDKLWARFSEEVKEIMVPLRQSRYMLQKSTDWSKLSKPIYKSKEITNFDKWVRTLTGYLASKVKQERVWKVFDSCRGVIKHDPQIALHVLPHVVVHVLLNQNKDDHKEVCKEILAVLDHVKEPETRHGSASDLRHMSAQSVFSVLEYLTRWTRHRMSELSIKAVSASRSKSASAAADFDYQKDDKYKQVTSFLDQIPLDTLAMASFNCGAYTRALMHYEQYVRTKQEDIQGQEHLDFIQKLYVALDEPDGVAGITAVKQTRPTLSEQILAFESIGQLSDASVCYDKAIQLEPQEISYRQGLLRCRLALGELHSAMDLANGMIAQRPSWHGHFNPYRVEAAWKLGQWDNLESYLKREDNTRNWNVGLGKILLAAKQRDENEFSHQLHNVRRELMGPLSAASMEVGSYHRGYEYIIRLHMLNELQQGVKCVLDFPKSTGKTGEEDTEVLDFAALTQHWKARMQFTQSSYKTLEPILNLRRIVLTLAQQEQNTDLAKQIGQCWMETARFARKCGLVQTAHSSLLSASAYNSPEVSIENAKWLWDRGDYDKAQTCLEKVIEEHYPDRTKLKADDSESGKAERLACAKVLLLLGRYCEETASWESNAIVRQYKEVTKVCPSWEDGYFHTAEYYDKLKTQLIEADRPHKKGEFVIQVVTNLGQSLMHGCQYIYQSMPRMLTLWLDYGTEVVDCEKTKADVVLQGKRCVLQHLNKLMSQFCAKLAPYQFLTALPQLISRICHPQAEVFACLRELLASVMGAFPQQSMWLMMAVSKSSYEMRKKRCLDIFGRAKSLNSQLTKFLQDATKLTDRLVDLCNKPVEGAAGTLSIHQHFKPLQRLIDDRNFSLILLPLQRLMTPTLPTQAVSPADHDAFLFGQVYIKGIEDTVEVLPSLQKPKKITLRGSDGKLYIMLCKPKDDLRKDARLMEFNGIVNKCLRKDPESRRRDLHIRTYTVTPLNEECGMMEWVCNTTGLRHILLKLYRERGQYTSNKELKTFNLPPNAPLQKKLDTFKNKLLPRHPALFSEWFLRTFTDPTSWYNARLAYCRTTAVMSMIGYILGLGDRHGENILLDSINGDCVHVDFNCLFNKGETFDYPEIVPFRLTHNMVEAMGLMGYEGIFRRGCEVTLRVMRDQSDPLMSVLKTFIYDPLVEWGKHGKGRHHPATESGEIRNEQAQTHVNNIESRLKGILKNKTKPCGLPLSVEGHVNHLIKEATDEKNLAQMYIGWAAYM